MLSRVPFTDGQHVRIVVTAVKVEVPRQSITAIRRLLKGNVQRFDDPFEPMIPNDSSEALK